MYATVAVCVSVCVLQKIACVRQSHQSFKLKIKFCFFVCCRKCKMILSSIFYGAKQFLKPASVPTHQSPHPPIKIFEKLVCFDKDFQYSRILNTIPKGQPCLIFKTWVQYLRLWGLKTTVKTKLNECVLISLENWLAFSGHCSDLLV